MATESTEVKKWRWLAALCGVFQLFGLVGMIGGAIGKKTDGISWGIYIGVTIAAAVLFVVMIAAGSGDAGDSVSASSQTSSNRSVSSEPAPRSEPANSFGNGDHLVGLDIQPGTYRATCDGGFIGMCYWARHSKEGGQYGIAGMTIIANDNKEVGSQAIVDILTSDYRFESDGFERWQKVN